MTLIVGLPIGPKGRTPSAVIEVVSNNTNATRAHLVMFQDGTMGIREILESTAFKVLSRDNGGYDGSEYMMLYHSPDHLSTIECHQSDDSRQSMFLRFSTLICSVYSAVYLFSLWSTGFNSYMPKSDYSQIIFVIFPWLVLGITSRLVPFHSGRIKVYPSATDPYKFTVPSIRVETAKKLLTYSVIIALGSVIGTERWCGLVLIFVLLWTAASHFQPGMIKTPVLLKKNKTDFAIQQSNLADFYAFSTDLVREISHRDRIENPELLELLMGNESPTLEFKASLWTRYKGTTDEMMSGQQKKDLRLQDAVVKTVAAFMNTDGGTLLIGVLDKPRSAGNQVAQVVGIEADYRWLSRKRADTEGFVHSLHQLLDDAFGDQALIKLHVNISTSVHEGKTICRLDVKPRKRLPENDVWVKTQEMGKEEFFFRTSDTTTHASAKSANRYIMHHFNHPRDVERES